MRFPEKAITLKDGRSCILRPTMPEDAAEMIEYMKRTADETPFLLRYPDEIEYTVDGERGFLSSFLDDPASVMMVAVIEGNLAGNCSITGDRSKRKLRHRCSMAIALYREYWNLGIGTAMIEYLIQLARQIGYEQMDLGVIAENEQALALYSRCGFIETGRYHHALKYDDGSCHDEILMYREL